MKNYKLLKSIALFLSWLTLSPLLLILDRRWKLLPKWLRIVLFVLSPLMMIVLFLIDSYAEYGFLEYTHKYRFTTPRAIKKITGVCFPDYKRVDYSTKQWWSHGPYDYITILEFKEMPDDNFYKALEREDNIFVENDTVVYSFMDKYKYWTLYNTYFFELWTYGHVFVEVKKGAKQFRVVMSECPSDNRYFRE